MGIIVHAANGGSELFFYLGFPSNPPESCSTLGDVHILLNIL